MIFCFVEVFSRISVGIDEKSEHPNCERNTIPIDSKSLHNVRARKKSNLDKTNVISVISTIFAEKNTKRQAENN